MNEHQPTAQIAHLVFANMQAKAKKTKELFFTYATKKIVEMNITT